ncbi:relaxase/mobilization nuclease domain-containing protein [Roseibium alexandrii]|uniref:MobA/VirD2-like nuclease domain-containing protein n=1 Tax=Roseibium alexandrii TaxID=388408 RepID=A0A0M7AUV9_9HYPH|nr:hypothetical protein [Roseibium alexandrii]CTQ77573.1 hypothetical protein LAX5112_04958 [Roseibium alexandrii]
MSRKGGQKVTVGPFRSLVADDPLDALKELEAISAIGRTKCPIHHVHVDPPIGHETPELFARHRELYEAEFGLEDAPGFSVRHEKNSRRHEHRVYTIVGSDGKAADLSWERARREKISRIIEHEFGLSMIAGKHNVAVEKALRKDGRDDVADAMLTAGLADKPRPDAVSPQERHIAERTGVPARTMDADILSAWRVADSGQAFRAALADVGIRIALGEKTTVVVRDGEPESLNRVLSREAKKQGFARITAADVKRRLSGLNIPDLADLDRTSTIYRAEKSVECWSGSSMGDPSPENNLVSGKEDFNAEPKTATKKGHSSRRAHGHPGNPRRRQDHQGRRERVDEPARSERDLGRAGSDRSDRRPAGGDQGRRSDDQRSSRSSKRIRNRLTAARLRKHADEAGKRKVHQHAKNRVAEAKLRARITPADFQKIRNAAELKARQKAARRMVAIARIRQAGPISFSERISALFRSRRTNLDRLLNRKQAAAEAIVLNTKPEPDALTKARHAVSAANKKRGDAYAQFEKTRKRLDDHYLNKPAWLRVNAWRNWNERRNRLTLLRNKASVQNQAAKLAQMVARDTEKQLSDAWHRNPDRHCAEKKSDSAIFEAKRELSLIHEVRRILREDPDRVHMRIESLLALANTRLEQRDIDREVKNHLESSHPGNSEITWKPKGL